MAARVHKLDAREGGAYRMSLTYPDPSRGPGGKTSDDSDPFQARFLAVVPNARIVERIEFELPDPAFAGEMTV